jgi:glutamyl-tRNA(Gln) amidotransferase subunit E
MMDNPITLAEWKKIGAALRAKKDDAIVLVWGDVKDSETAAGEIVIRAGEAAEGIPNETRQAFPTGINGFERILPGPDRMYPDTDMPPAAVSEERIERARGRLPMPPWDRRAYFRKLGLSPEIIEDLVIDERLPLFRKAVESLSFDPTLAAVLLSQTLKSLKRKGFPVSTLGDEEILDLLVRYVRGEFAREAFPDILKRMSMGNLPAAETLANLGLVPLGDEDVREIIRIVEGVERNLDPQDHGKKFRYLMGVLMADLRGRFPGEKVASFLLGAMERGTNLF